MNLPDLPKGEHAPFILLDDASREGAGRATLFRDPVDIIRANRIAEVLPALERIEAAGARGLHAAGYLSYAAGHAFEPRLTDYAPSEGDEGPLLWFGLFEQGHEISPQQVPALLPAGDVSAPSRAGPTFLA